MVTFFKTIHLSAAVLLILVVLLQSGRGGGIGSALSGATGQIFGGRGANTFLTRVTSGLAMVFFCTSLTLSMLSSRHHSVVPRESQAGEASQEEGAAPTDDSGAERQDELDAPAAPQQPSQEAATK